jgi:hypothetical protein
MEFADSALFVINAVLSDVADPTVVVRPVAFRPIETRETNWGRTENDNFAEVAVTATSDLQP